MHRKKILITGSQGFIGSHLLEKFLPNNKIIGVNIKTHTKTKNYKSLRKDIVKLNSKDISEPLDGIIHLAAISDVDFCNNNPQKCLRTNVLGTLNVLDIARKNDSKFIFISTSHVYGKPQSLPIKEDHPKNPTSIYAVSKSIGENCCESFAKSYGLKLSILRLFSVYGSNSPPNLVISKIISQLNKKSIQLGNIHPKRDFVFIDDVVEAIKLVLEKSKGFAVYNVGTGKSHSILNVCNILKKLANKKIPIRSKKANSRKTDINEVVANISKIKKLGWKSKTSLEQGLKKTLDLSDNIP